MKTFRFIFTSVQQYPLQNFGQIIQKFYMRSKPRKKEKKIQLRVHVINTKSKVRKELYENKNRTEFPIVTVNEIHMQF